MPTQAEKAALFASLHVRGDPVILVNIWDAGSAQTVAEAGAKALATGSHPIADSIGHEDGEGAPLADMLWVLERITKATDLPVSHDTERGYGETPDAVAETCRRVIGAGAIGVNIEDSLSGAVLRDADEQLARLAKARLALDEACAGAWLNARCDVFNAMKDASLDDQLGELKLRAEAYEAAGADSLFMPFVRDLETIQKVCASVPLPVNVMRPVDGAPIADYAAAGVARVSHGGSPRSAVMAALNAIASDLYAS
ncbi:MAG: isocitrate lyase/phosphoenolpyruvate mutase family protein [Pseudomonadota bacterium]